MSADDTVESLTVELAGVERRINGLQEDADRAGMFQDVSKEWFERYMSALRVLSKARTHRNALAQRLDIAKRIEEERAEQQRRAEIEQRHRKELEKEIAEAGVLG